MFSLSLFTLAFAAISTLASPIAQPVAEPTATKYNGTISRRGANVYTSCQAPKTIALTFDDGPYVFGHDLVDILSGKGVKATFFVNGNNWRCIYDQDMRNNVKYAYDKGHLIGSHTWGHLDLTTLSWDQIHDQMWRTEQAIMRITGAYPAHMRPPYGNYNDLVLQAAQIRGQDVFLWDFDNQDSTGATPQTSHQLYDAAISQQVNNLIALNHETYSTTVYDVVGYAIDHLQAAGYQFATVAECLGLPAYQYVGAPATPDASWTC